MKNLLLFALFTFSFNAYAEGYFAELRLGASDRYHKVVNHATNGKLEGDFTGPNAGLRFGKRIGEHAVFLEYNPEQQVEIKSANELANVQSTLLGYRYHLNASAFFVGGQVGQSSFELVNGPNGVTFVDNPITKGMTYGVHVGYIEEFEDVYLGADIAYNFGSYKEGGPSSTPVTDIEIQNQSQVNVVMGVRF